MSYLLLKYVHVISVVVAVGANLTYPLWLSRLRHSPTALLFTLRTVKFLDSRIANPAYVVALVTGFGMLHLSKMPMTTPWILAPIVLFIIVGALGGFYSITLRKQIALAEKSGDSSPEFKALSSRGNRLGAFIFILVLVIIYIMVAKPRLWG